MQTTENSQYSISVIVPVYNSGTSALLSIQSILNQSHSCDEIIVVDDGSTDGSYELIHKNFSDIEIIKVVKINNRGAAGARNFGISLVTSNYIAFLDSDDVWVPSKIQKQIDFIKSDPTVGMIGALTSLKNFNASRIFNSKPYTDITVRDLLFKNYFQTSTVLVSRKLMNSVGGFPEGRRYAEEGDFFLRIAAKGKCILMNEILVDYDGGKPGFGVSGLSANLLKMEIGEICNIINVYRRAHCSFFIFLYALIFSILKFIRRLIIKKFLL